MVLQVACWNHIQFYQMYQHLRMVRSFTDFSFFPKLLSEMTIQQNISCWERTLCWLILLYASDWICLCWRCYYLKLQFFILLKTKSLPPEDFHFMYLPVSQSITFSHLFKTDFPDSLPLYLPKPKESCKFNPRKLYFILTCSSFPLENNPEEQTSKCNILPLVA